MLLLTEKFRFVNNYFVSNQSLQNWSKLFFKKLGLSSFQVQLTELDDSIRVINTDLVLMGLNLFSYSLKIQFVNESLFWVKSMNDPDHKTNLHDHLTNWTDPVFKFKSLRLSQVSDLNQSQWIILTYC